MYLYTMKQWSLMLCLLGTFGLPGVLDVAKSFLGVPYVSGTLESEGKEYLIVDTTGMDCTTFVELSVARYMEARDSDLTFEQHVQCLRYRRGKVDGYLSRLHYFTDWVNENVRRDVWYELGSMSDNAYMWRADTLQLCFMSAHPDSYPYLKAHAWAVDSLRTMEKSFWGYPVSYIDKSFLNLPSDSLPIRDGDILALVTTVEGLDVSHLGFAVWQNEKLHLMHASMNHGRVVIDERTLYDYLKTRKGCPGVRVVRLRE